MEWYDIEVDGEHTVKFADLPYVPLLSPTQSSPRNGEQHDIGHKLGGIIRQGEWSWTAKNAMFQVVSLRNGQTISSYEFCESSGYDSCCIKCIEEIHPNNTDIMLLAVVLESYRGPGGGSSFVVLYSVEQSSILSSIELGLHATCAKFMDDTSCRRSLLQNFDGCLAVGSEEGVVVLLDLNIHKLNAMSTELPNTSFVPCHIVDFSLPLTEIHRNFRQCRKDGVHFGLQMEVIESPCSIQCILPIDLITALAIGLEDGRMALYDLAELQIFYVAIPKRELAMSTLVKMDYLEPPDDPRPCLYIWALHENGETLHAVMHNLMYEKRLIEEDDEEEQHNASNKYYFESFLTCSVRLQLPLEATKSLALACQTISSFSSHGEDDSHCLCAISWYSVLEEKNKLLIFDLNQWYKEEMPFALEFDQQPSYLAGYILNGQCVGLDVQLKPDTIAHFNSIQRFEEHFYPNSLSFDCSLLHEDGCRRYNWEGAQNRVINLLRVSNASIFLEPNNCFNEIMRARLMPQFTDLNLNSTFSKSAKHEIMLSTALENNCISLLRDCAKSWIDGSFMGNFAISTGLSLSTLTEWIWQRATAIKSRCNDMCKGLFEFGGYPLDQREQKQLGFLTRQLKLLFDLLGEILVMAKRQVAERVYSSLESNHNSLRMASNYQDILLWLLNIGLLPEASPYNAKINTSHDLVPYPYKELKDMYKKKRLYFNKINENFTSKKSGSCRLLFIDAFIDHACKGNVLHEFWLENDGDGLYPPNSIEGMLRVMLVPGLKYEDKYAILLYFFLDLNMAIDEEAYKGVVANFIKFPSVFKLSAPLIKTVQSFWNLDHDQFLPAVDEFISPFNKNQNYPQWMVELLIESLLTQNAANLALRILESQPSLISPVLKLKTLLANKLIAEAFHFVRSKNDDSLLEVFFTFCLSDGQFGIIRDLALNEREGLILQTILKRSKAPGAESLHFVYLLQKSKYIEAVTYMDELSTKSKSSRSSMQQHQHSTRMETPNMVLSAFNTTMTPVTQGLTDVYFRIKNKIKKKEVDNKSPVPLSCQLIKQNANGLLGGIYHSSALSAHFATYYWGELDEQSKYEGKHLLNSNNAPFLRRPQIEAGYMDYTARNSLSYPQVYKAPEKRTFVESEVSEDAESKLERQRIENLQNPKKKRRLIAEEIVNDLSHFMNMNKHKAINLNGKEFTFNEDQTDAKDDEESLQSVEILTRPPPTAGHTKGGRQKLLSQTNRPELQGILKTNTPDSQAHQHEDEKYLRFRLPSIDLDSTEGCIPEEGEEHEEKMDIVENEEEQPSGENVAAVESSMRVKQIARSVSVESAKSEVSSTNSSEDNYYSPLSSQNNSKLDCSNVSRSSFMGGPKARRPLSRLSAEKEESKDKRLSDEWLPTLKPTSRISAEKDQKSKSKSREPSPRPKPKSKSREPFPRPNSKSQSREPSPRPKSKSKSREPSPRPQVVTAHATEEDKHTSNAEYVTAVGHNIFSISSRKSLQSVTEGMEIKEHTAIKSTYITAINTTQSSLFTKTEISQASSGFGSISARSISTGSKITEFIPKVSSSKVGITPIKPDSQTTEPAPRAPRSPAKLSECTTVIGPFDYTSSATNNVFAMPSIPLEKSKLEERQKHTEEQKKQMLETTLSMSTYDISMLDTSALQPTKSSFMVTANEKESTSADDSAFKDKEENKELRESSTSLQDAEAYLMTTANDKETSLASDSCAKAEENMNSSDVVMLSSTSLQETTSDVIPPAKVKENPKDKVLDSTSKQTSESSASLKAKKEETSSLVDSPGKTEDQLTASSKETSSAKEEENQKNKDILMPEVTAVKESSVLEAENEKTNKEGDKTEASNNDENIEPAEEIVVKLKVDCESESEAEDDKPLAWGDLMNSSDDDCIVLSSSSSYIDDNDYGRPFDFRSSDGTDDETSRMANDVESEKSFDTGDYDDYDQDMAETEEDSIGVSNTGDNAESNDIVEITDDTSSEAGTNSNSTEQSNTEDKSSASSSQATSNGKADIDWEKDEQQVVSTTTDNEADTSQSQAKENPSLCTTSSEVITSTVEAAEEMENKREQENSEREMESQATTGLTKSNSQTPAISSVESTDVASTSEVKEETKVKETLASVGMVDTEEQFTLKMEDCDSIESTDIERNISKKIADEQSRDNNADDGTNNKTEEGAVSEEPAEEKSTRSNSRNSRRISVSAKDLESTILTPRRRTRGASVPPSVSDLNINSAASSRRTSRGTSIPPSGVGLTTTRQDSVDNSANNRHDNTGHTHKKVKSPIEEVNKDSTPPLAEKVLPSRRSFRGTSVPPLDLEPVVVASPRRNTRGISVHPQITEEDVSNTPSSRRRSLRASSLQPKSKTAEDTSANIDGSTPRKHEKGEDISDTPSRSARGSSVPAASLAGKLNTRRRSILLDAITEDSATPDSPSTNTRFRSRLNSMESEADQSVTSLDQPNQLKRSRRDSLSGTSAAALPLTPKRGRRNSMSSQSETVNVTTPRTIRGRSVLSTVDDETEVIPASPKPTNDTRLVTGKRKSSTDEHKNENKASSEHKGDPETGKKMETSKEEPPFYSTTSRRLTRTQLAIMEKSVGLAKNVVSDVLPKEADISPPSNAKRNTKTRSTRSTAHDSDDAESTTSKMSTNSSAATTSKRRVTRRSGKNKEEDDVTSVASSVGSEKDPKPRRSKDKSSPSSTLSAIPEDGPIETKKRSRIATKHH